MYALLGFVVILIPLAGIAIGLYYLFRWARRDPLTTIPDTEPDEVQKLGKQAKTYLKKWRKS
jgi:hypothetical protein